MFRGRAFSRERSYLRAKAAVCLVCLRTRVLVGLELIRGTVHPGMRPQLGRARGLGVRLPRHGICRVLREVL